MTRIPTTAVLCLAALSLAACNGRQGGKANSQLCYDFKAAPVAQTAAVPAATPTAADAAAPVDDCVRRWAYSLAPSRDSAETVSEAVVAACSGALSRWNQQSLTQQPPGGPPEEAISLRTGQPTNPLAEHSVFASDRALFYVVQARAGNCPPPPASKGAPTGAAN